MKKITEIAPAVILYEGVIENPQGVIDFVSNSDSWKDSEMFLDAREDFYKNNDQRNTKIFHVPVEFPEGSLWHTLSEKIFNCVDHYATYNRFRFSGMEALQILKYYTNEGFYDEHIDDGPNMNRICSSVLYLNDVEEGGETYFTKFNLSVKPIAGNMIVFPANYAYAHKALPPKSSEKFSVVTWYKKYK